MAEGFVMLRFSGTLNYLGTDIFVCPDQPLKQELSNFQKEASFFGHAGADKKSGMTFLVDGFASHHHGASHLS